jgi:hypothetical protein
VNRIEPVGRHDDDVAAIPPVPRRAPDRERKRDQQSPRDKDARPAADNPVQLPSSGDDGEHVDVRA